MAAALLFIFYCIEAGVFFTVAPWTRFWANNGLLHSTELVAAVAQNGFVRGFVSGFGIIHLMVGLREIFLLLKRRPGRLR